MLNYSTAWENCCSGNTHIAFTSPLPSDHSAARPYSTQLIWLSPIGRFDHNPQLISTPLVQFTSCGNYCDSEHLS